MTMNTTGFTAESESTLHQVIDLLPAAITILIGPQFIVEHTNPANLAYWQKSREEVFGRPLLDVLPELADQPFPGQLKHVLETGETIVIEEGEVKLEGPDGLINTTYVDYSYQPLKDKNGKRVGVLVMSNDVTDRVEARNRLTESEEQIRALVAGAPFPIAVYIGREMRIVQANKAIIDVWGKGNDVIGNTYYNLLPELEEQNIYPLLDSVFVTGKPFHARNEQVNLTVNGKLTKFYFNYSFTPLLDKDGNIYGVLNTAADVTDLNVAKQQVEQSEENFRNMITQAPVAMCLMRGPEHTVELVNSAMLEIWGKPYDGVIGKPVFDALPDAREQGLEQLMAEVYSSGVPFFANETPVELIRYGKPDIVYQNFVYQPYRDSEGAIAGVLAISVDVTEQVMARRKIEQSETELLAIKERLEEELEAGKQLQQQKDGFIGMASHELKTPLTSLNAIVQLAHAKHKSKGDVFFTGMMEKALNQVKRMNNLINGFLNISRMESGQVRIEKTDFDLDSLLKEIVAEHQLTATGHLIELNICDNATIHADREKIGSVISNLVSNAVKYSPNSSMVIVQCKRIENRVQVSVKDQGIGIQADDLDRIFDRYYRVETNYTRHVSGFGIGLYLSADIIKRHDGDIWVESTPDAGSTFYFSLPVV